MSLLRLCTHKGCELKGRHVENCPRCFGFGVNAEGPIPSGDLNAVRLSGAWSRCPDCGGTPNGRTDT